ncbi:MAG TPA: C-terminal helicase domain-containing protein, partial [Polyangiaceae bacterium]|nr:C-terminal helicase domain-containing protein [Polyangiaceae bacterium]
MLQPQRVAVDPVASVGTPISQGVYFVDMSAKLRLLVSVLRCDRTDRALVFTRTKHGANRLADNLIRAGLQAAAIHGNKSQSARERALEGFKRGDLRVVVATDIAARGIDIKGLSHVINYDMPVDPESYVHRIGRTGRAGLTGIALSFCAPQERPELLAIERLTRMRIDPIELPTDLAHAAPARALPDRSQPAQRRSQPDPRRSPAAPIQDQSPARPFAPPAKAPRPGYAPSRRRRGFA